MVVSQPEDRPTRTAQQKISQSKHPSDPSSKGVGQIKHHQNARAERAIQTIMSMARTYMIHVGLRWSRNERDRGTTDNLALWAFAVRHPCHVDLQSPAYLTLSLVPKWKQRSLLANSCGSRRSTRLLLLLFVISSLAKKVVHNTMLFLTFDDKFEAVYGTEYDPGVVENVEKIDAEIWANGHDYYAGEEFDKAKVKAGEQKARAKRRMDECKANTPGLGWTTVRLMLILEVLLNLKSNKQGNIKAAFLHLHASPGKVLMLKKTLYGLRQSPRAFWKYMVQEMANVGMPQSDLDPCIFVGEKVICICYVDDLLFWARDEVDISSPRQADRSALWTDQSRGPAVALRPGTGAGIPGSAARESQAECRTGTSATGRGPAVASQGPRQPASLQPAPGRYKFPEASTNSKPHSESSLSQPLLDFPKSPFTDGFAPSPDLVAIQLELAGVIGHNDILANCTTIQEVTTATRTDNTAAAAAHSWATKGAVSSTGPSSYYLLRLKSMHQRTHRYQLRTFYIPGPINKMADDCSRFWHLTDKELLEYFNRTYPQAVPWQIRELSPAMHEALNLALLCKRAPPEALDVVLKPVDESDTGFPQGWELPVSAASHGFRQRLYEQFALRPKSWTDRRPTPINPTSTSPNFRQSPEAQLPLLTVSSNLKKPNFYSTPEAGLFLSPVGDSASLMSLAFLTSNIQSTEYWGWSRMNDLHHNDQSIPKLSLSKSIRE
ncbi:hypothetical protein THAOC_19768 [Thalassiosira oceanica]|uniref:Reverse transcriptase Ty1/copia-type domain-containing protein n=1 Tax=Thalassiosira oceanica TaxID=159749 RepID=K0SG71_THAOC|nr:hypothetical protein THAOC_19768 [Thalassiosira oceanica]|eukprot:EJK59956.1 hypothetical protein THAOC_19768 [Thalassiosira oceanica]